MPNNTDRRVATEHAIRYILQQHSQAYLTDFELTELINDVQPGKQGSLPWPARYDDMNYALEELTKTGHIIRAAKGSGWHYRINSKWKYKLGG